MRIKTILVFVLIMPFTVFTYAQNAKGKSLHWKIAAKLPAPDGKSKSLGVAGPVTGVHNDILIVGGGANFPDSMPWQGGKKKYYDDIYSYREHRGTLVLQKEVVKLPSAIAYPANCSTPQGVVYAGGENEQGFSNKVYLLKWDETKKTILSSELPELPHPLTNASAVYVNSTIYLAGGETPTAVSSLFLKLDLNNLDAGWQALPDIPKPVSHTVMVALEGKSGNVSIYIVGGRKRNSDGISELYNTVFSFDTQKGAWEKKQNLPYALSAGTGIAQGQKNILIFGGDRGETFHKTEKLIAAINAETDEAKKSELIRQKNELQSSHPGFSHDVLVYNIESNEWKKLDEISFDSPVTTTAVVWNKKVLIPSGEIKAGVRTPQILMAKLSGR